MTGQKIVGFFLVLLIMAALLFLVWGIGYEGEDNPREDNPREDYQSLTPTEISEGVTVVGVGEEFKLSLPKADDPNQVWILLKETPKLVKVDINRSGEEEVWTFRALRVGHAPLEFSWSMLDRGVWPSDERRIIEIEVR